MADIVLVTRVQLENFLGKKFQEGALKLFEPVELLERADRTYKGGVYDLNFIFDEKPKLGEEFKKSLRCV